MIFGSRKARMRRRDFITLIGGAAAWPLGALAQQAGKTHRLGFLGGADPVGYAPQLKALHLGLHDHGYIEGRNVEIEYRWAEGNYERLPTLAAELVALKVDVIITQGTPAAVVAKAATATIPIVMAIVGNPVESGIVPSLARPGANITGSSFFHPEINAKRVGLIKTLLPGIARAGVLLHPDNRAMIAVLSSMQETAQALNISLQRLDVRSLGNIDAALERGRTQIEALVVVDEGLFIANAVHIAEIARRSGLPSIGFREYGEAGGLAAYGVDFPHIWRRSMALVDKTLKGAKPADLPIEQATRFEFIINLKTARALGLEIPPTLLARADEVIE
jgi:putative tryptophan/tyrosine transport system substrate-binding protein